MPYSDPQKRRESVKRWKAANRAKVLEQKRRWRDRLRARPQNRRERVSGAGRPPTGPKSSNRSDGGATDGGSARTTRTPTRISCYPCADPCVWSSWIVDLDGGNDLPHGSGVTSPNSKTIRYVSPTTKTRRGTPSASDERQPPRVTAGYVLCAGGFPRPHGHCMYEHPILGTREYRTRPRTPTRPWTPRTGERWRPCWTRPRRTMISNLWPRRGGVGPTRAADFGPPPASDTSSNGEKGPGSRKLSGTCAS